ncbi:hypothetical protein BJ912DRAFT_959675 [Pholiota molesta]|nr:hypothetical protein BJ912DRAFT_959675 [Pholiota molesta]
MSYYAVYPSDAINIAQAMTAVLCAFRQHPSPSILPSASCSLYYGIGVSFISIIWFVCWFMLLLSVLHHPHYRTRFVAPCAGLWLCTYVLFAVQQTSYKLLCSNFKSMFFYSLVYIYSFQFIASLPHFFLSNTVN